MAINIDLRGEPLFSNSGEVEEALRSTDWAHTVLGPPDTWPATMRATLGVCFGSAWRRDRGRQHRGRGHDLHHAHPVRHGPPAGASHQRRAAARLDRHARRGVRRGGAALASRVRGRTGAAGRRRRGGGQIVLTRGARVLVADDNADMREYLRELLGRYWTVATVSDGQAALEAARAEPPDLVLSDVMMPRLDGFALLAELRADPCTSAVPVVLLSARTGDEARVEGLRGGADAYMAKPFAAAELIARVDAQLALSRLRQAHMNEARRRLDALPMIAWEFDASGDVRYVNEQYCQYTGIPRGSALGAAWHRLVHPDDVEAHVAQRTVGVASGARFDTEVRVLRADGTYRWHSVEYAPLHDRDGAITGWIGAAADIELVKRAEDAIGLERNNLRAAIMQAPIPMVVYRGPELTVEIINGPALEIGGWHDVEGKPLLEIMPEAAEQGLDSLMHEVMRSGEPFVGREVFVRFDRADGVRESYFNFVYAPLRSGNGDIEGLIAVANEVTEEVRARAATEAMNEELRRANAIKDEFLGLVSHELRTPITMVMGNAQLLTSRADSLSDADRASALTDIAREAERLNQIIENLLIVARYERGQRPEVEPTELRRFVRNACARFGQTHGRRVEVRTSSDVWCLAEHSYLEQVVDNVLTNADKYSPAGAEVTVSVCLREDEAIVSVEDRGPGVNDEERQIIFSSFWCEPRDGGGSVFSFTLPLLTDVGEG